jgi:hypothetical protein
MHLLLSEHQKQWLDYEAERTHRSVADIIRQCLLDRPEYRTFFALGDPSPTVTPEPLTTQTITAQTTVVHWYNGQFIEERAGVDPETGGEGVEPSFAELDNARMIAIDEAKARGVDNDIVEAMIAERIRHWPKLEEE